MGAAKITKADVVDAFRAARDSRTASPGEAHTFENVSDVRLEFTEMHKLFEADVHRIVHELTATRQFRDYATYPPQAKLALLDVAFTSGVGKILMPSDEKGFPRMTAAIGHRDWSNAAHELHNWNSVQPSRKKQGQIWYRAAAKMEPFYLRSSLHQPGTVLLETFFGNRP